MNQIIKVENINKSFGDHHVLAEINFEVYQSDFVALVGPSGSGKSTLLNIVGLLDTKDSGTLTLFDYVDPKPMSRTSVKLLRNRISYLFQNYALIDDKSVEYNLKIALKYNKSKNKKQLIKDALEYVGLKGFEKKKISHCSGGEQQRIAIARILLKPCDVILCDEPTGSLDEHNKNIIIDLLKKIHQDGKAIIVVTHDKDVMDAADKVIRLAEL